MNDVGEEWAALWAALRLRGVALGDILPEENEKFDLLTIWALRLNMSKVKVIGFTDVENKPRGPEWTTRFKFEHFEIVDMKLLYDAKWREGLRERARAAGYYPSGKPGSRDGGVFDPVFIAIEAIQHNVGGEPIDNRKTTG